MTLLTLDDISLTIADQPLFRNADLSLEDGERVCLVGRNGAGKSTLMRMITGEQQPDSGDIRYRQHLRISQLHQSLPEELDESVHDFVRRGLTHLAGLIRDYERLAGDTPDAGRLRELEALQQQIEAEGGWNLDQQVEAVLTDLDLPTEGRMDQLSGGWRRRVALARALVSKPDLLLLDEPTNHLDLATIGWLEDRIRSYPGGVLFITHDRAFLQNLATRIVEIDRTALTSWPGDYRNFLRRKEEALHAEDRYNEEFDKRLKQEEAWIRQGLKARRTRNEGRVRNLQAMREQADQRIRRRGGPRIAIEEAEGSGRKVIELYNVRKSYGNEQLIDGLTMKVMRGDRIGLIGNNGVGKSTLLKIMLGREEPDEGTVKLGTNLEIGYFDQLRRELDPEKTVVDIVGDGRDYIRINGKDRHVIGYLKGFLFEPERAMTRVGALSGGECNRVILAKLFTRPTNLLVLDEPTNDLDMETLEALEKRLMEYDGTLIVVSHDRAFMDNVVDTTLVFEEGGRVRRHAGGFSDWLRKGRRLAVKEGPVAERKTGEREETARRGKKPGNRKLSYKLKLELDGLPDRIEALERRIEEKQAEVNDPDFYARPFDQIQPVLDEMTELQSEHERLMARWMELEERAGRA